MGEVGFLAENLSEIVYLQVSKIVKREKFVEGS